MTDQLSGTRLLWLYLLLMLLAGWQLLSLTRVQTDMSAFMPKAQDKAEQLLLQQLQQGPAARLWLLALTGATPDVLAETSLKLVRKADTSALVKHVMNGSMTLDRETRDRLFEYRYLLSNRITPASFTQPGLRQMFDELLQTLRSPMSTFSKQLSQSDPGGEFLYLLQSLDTPGGAPALRQGVWFNEAGNQALLLLESAASGTDLDAQFQLHQQLQLWLEELAANDSADQAILLKMGGVPLISLQTRERIRQTSQRLSLAASIFMLLFMFLVYRHPRKVLFTALPLLTGVLTGAACVSWWFDGIHGITLAFGITLLGVAVDYPVHLLSHQRPGEGLEQAAVRIWPTLGLSVLSTVLGFSVMLWTDFPGLAQLGLFSVSGLLAAALVTRYLLPRMAGTVHASVSGLGKPHAADSANVPGVVWKHYHLLLHAAAKMLDGRIKLLLLLILLLGMAWIVQGKDLWSRDIQALSPVPAETKLMDQRMRQAMGAPEPGHVMLLTAGSVQQLLDKQEQMQPLLNEAISRGYVQQLDYAARILPSEELQLQRRSWIPPQKELALGVDEALGDLPFNPKNFAAFTEALQHSAQLQPITPDRLDHTVLGMRFNSLLQETPEGVSGLIRLVGVHDLSALAELLQVHARDDLWLLDIPGATSELVDKFRSEVLGKAVLALIVIGILTALWLRNLPRLLGVISPVLLSVAVSVTVILGSGSSLNLFHLVALLLVAGIGLDYGLFFSRSLIEPGEWQQTAHALGVSCCSTVVVFSMLATSDIPVLQAIGLTVASGALAAFVLSWLLSGNMGFSQPHR